MTAVSLQSERTAASADRFAATSLMSVLPLAVSRRALVAHSEHLRRFPLCGLLWVSPPVGVRLVVAVLLYVVAVADVFFEVSFSVALWYSVSG